MPNRERFKTRYPGVYYVDSISNLTGKQEKIYFIIYRKNSKLIEEKASSQFKDNMTPAKASHISTLKITGRLDPNREHRQKIKEKVTIDYLFDVFRENKTHLRSLHDDVIRYNLHVRHVFGSMEVSEIKPIMLNKLRDKLMTDHKPATVKQILVLIQRIVNFGNSMQVCPRFGFKIDMPKFDNKKTEYMTEEQYKRFLSVLDNYEVYHADSADMMRVALFTGMRKKEILGLLWSDVDFERGFISIRESEAKGKHGEIIPMNSLARNVLFNVSRRRRSDYVFPNKKGGCLEETSYQEHLLRIRERAGLPKSFRPMHGLRHTFASNLASSGKVDLYTLQRLLTHKTPDMTQRYAHLRDNALIKASEVTVELHKNIAPLNDTSDEE